MCATPPSKTNTELAQDEIDYNNDYEINAYIRIARPSPSGQ
jgi:hypothetical protein